MANRIKVHCGTGSRCFVEMHVLTGDEDHDRDYVRALVERGGFTVVDRGRWDQLPRMAKLGVGWEGTPRTGCSD